jgi:hypothetical protein
LSMILLEVVARLLFPAPVPWSVREGVYHHSLPVINGAERQVIVPEAQRDSQLLPLEKASDELRVFVFGESSVQGAPWNLGTSAPAMLRDLLSAALPERRVTVTNMGRGSTMTVDAYYYLIGVARFQPDIIVFYQGVNDRFDVDAEMCAPAEGGLGYGIWRSLVARSRLLWTLRVHGPAAYLSWLSRDESWKGPPVLGAELCDKRAGFTAWTRTLIERAQASGAQVIVATPLASDFWDLDERYGPASRRPGAATDGSPGPQRVCPREASFVECLDLVPEAYRQVLRCILQEDCRAALPSRDASSPELAAASRALEESAQTMRAHTEMLGAAWRESAQALGATVIEFNHAMRARSAAGALLPPLLQDGIHLSLDGYWLLAKAWEGAVLSLVTGAPAQTIESLAGLTARGGAYIPMLDAMEAERHGKGYCARLAEEWTRWAGNRLLLTGVSATWTAAETCQDAGAARALDWLRLKSGLTELVPEERRAALAPLGFDEVFRRPEGRGERGGPGGGGDHENKGPGHRREGNGKGRHEEPRS